MNDPYTVIDEKTIAVCAWCFPGEKIFDLFPDMRGKVQISHGICNAHFKQKKYGILRHCDVDETITLKGAFEPIKLDVLTSERKNYHEKCN